MKKLLISSFVALSLLTMAAMAGPANAACYADYKAKRDNPLRLHYGIIELNDAACGNQKRARTEIADRISPSGWTLLNILALFGADGLEERKNSAGEFFLRF